jgi:hypothetical protein
VLPLPGAFHILHLNSQSEDYPQALVFNSSLPLLAYSLFPGFLDLVQAGLSSCWSGDNMSRLTCCRRQLPCSLGRNSLKKFELLSGKVADTYDQ